MPPRRMLALALVREGKSRTEAALSCGMDRQTLRDWVHRDNRQGLSGLCGRPHPGRPPRLSPAQMSELGALVETGPDPDQDGVVRWRRIDLRAVVERRFGIGLHERTMGTLLHKLHFAKLSVRPPHPEGDEDAQAAFKNTLPSR